MSFSFCGKSTDERTARDVKKDMLKSLRVYFPVICVINFPHSFDRGAAQSQELPIITTIKLAEKKNFLSHQHSLIALKRILF